MEGGLLARAEGAEAEAARLRGELADACASSASAVARAAQAEAALADALADLVLSKKATEAAEAEAARLRGEPGDALVAAASTEATTKEASATRACPALPIDIWMEILNKVDTSRDAAMLACSFSAAKAAHARSKWPRAVRVKRVLIERSGAVLEPASGTFDVTVAPGEDVQAAVDRCPPGGSVLLLPGTHDGPLALAAGKDVHVFGRRRATLRSAVGTVLTSEAAKATVDGLIVRREAGSLAGWDYCALIKGGALRIQACDITCAVDHVYCVAIKGGADPVLASCKIHSGRYSGVHISGVGTKGRLEGCDVVGNKLVGVAISHGADPLLTACKISGAKSCGVFIEGGRGCLERCEVWGNEDGGVHVIEGGDPTLVACTIRDHTMHMGRGVYVHSSALNKATVGADCVFARNAGGDVVRQEEDEEEEDRDFYDSDEDEEEEWDEEEEAAEEAAGVAEV